MLRISILGLVCLIACQNPEKHLEMGTTDNEYEGTDNIGNYDDDTGNYDTDNEDTENLDTGNDDGC